MKKIVDSQKNLFYSSRYKWETNRSLTESNLHEEGRKRKKDLSLEIKSLTKQDLVEILTETSNSFSNVKVPAELFEKMLDQNISQFKNQLESVIMSHSEDQQHKHEIERIYYEIQRDANHFEMSKITFYYFFKMNSLFANWGIFDYNTFQTRCKSINM